MKSLKILRSKEVKEILKFLESRYGIGFNRDYVFFKNRKDKIYILNKDVAKLDLKSLNIDTMGFYFCNEEVDGYRLSFDGSQMIKAKKNIIELNEEEKINWMKGEDVLVEMEDGYFILKFKEDFLGCGKIKDNKLLNYVPKSRRIF